MSPQYAARADENQPEIVEELRAMGYKVAHTHALGRGLPDIVVAGPLRLPGILFTANAMVWVEIKTPGGKLTELEQKFHSEWAGLPVIVAECAEDILDWFYGRKRTR